MPEADPFATPTLVQQYFARFGAAGDFDRHLLPIADNLTLMETALARGTPVSEADLIAAIEARFGVFPPGEPIPPEALF